MNNKRVLSFLLTGLMSCTAMAADKGLSVSLGSLPGVYGLENAYLTDRKVSGEGSTSEKVYMKYADSNSGLFNPAIFFSKDVIKDYDKLNLDPDEARISGELGLGFGNAVLIQANLKLDYKVMTPSSNSKLFVSPLIGVGIVSQQMGVVPQFPGQINTVEGDFDPGSEINLSSTAVILGLNVGYAYDFFNASWFASLGYQFAVNRSTKVTINDVELGGDVHASNCTGQSSQNLECNGYFDPFEDVSGLSGLTLQIGAVF